MSTNRSRRIDHDTAEQLLGAAVVGTSGGQASLTGRDDGAGHDALARLLSAAAAPAAAGELTGEAAALAAFRAAARPAAVPDPVAVPDPARVPAAPPRRRLMSTAVPAKAFSAKAAAVALLASALGGVAVAAGTGNLPSALGGGPAPADRVAVPVVSAPASETAPAEPTGAPASAVPSGRSGPSATPSGRSTGRPAAPATGSPSAAVGGGARETGRPGEDGAAGASAGPADLPALLLTLCQDLTDEEDGPAGQRALVVEPRFAQLLRAAGGSEKVTGYCTALLAGGHRSADPEPSSSTAGTSAVLPSPIPTIGQGLLPGRSDATSTRR